MATPADVTLERPLPSNIEAERCILGAVLLDNHVLNTAVERLRSEDFFLSQHRHIFERMIQLAEKRHAIDTVTLMEDLSSHGVLEASGGVAYISQLADGLPRVTNVEHYARIVKEKAVLRSLIHSAAAIQEQALAAGDEADTILDRAENAIFQLAEDRVRTGLIGIKEVVRDGFERLEKIFSEGRRITGLATGYAGLDNETAGLQPSELIILAARPSMGKTAWAINIAQNAAVHDGKVVAVFSLEMSKESLLRRLLASEALVNSRKIQTGFLPKEDKGKLLSALERLMDSKMFIDDTPGITLAEMRAKVRRLKQQEGRLDLIVVDYLQLMTGTNTTGKKGFENRTQEVSAISRGLKALAKEMKVPVLALSQLSRGSEQRGGDKKPLLSDLRESGSIEQDADVVAFIHREEYYDRDNEDVKGKAEIIVAKQRNGPTGSVNLAYLADYTRFENLASDAGGY